MKLWALAFGVAGVGGAVLPAPPTPWVLVVAGDADGYLSPCGCTAPMTGGVKRRATAVKQLAAHAKVVLIDVGGLGGSSGRQSEMKAETSAQLAAQSDAAAVHLTDRDAALGRGTVAAVAQLSEGRLVSTSLPEGAIEGVKPYAERGPFLIGGAVARTAVLGEALGASPLTPETAARRLIVEAKRRKKAPVLMLADDLAGARALATRVPGLSAIVYRSAGDPPGRPTRVGGTTLVSPGEKGKHLIRLAYDGKSFGGYTPIRLDPGFKDDPDATRVYAAYLRRVDRANLLDQVPRAPSDPFAGTERCGTCHAKAHEVWSKSKHRVALDTLEHEGHARDPDCVSCHVVGLEKEGGFRSRLQTPDLAHVGCESCHGAGAKHAADPKSFRFPKVTDAACLPCHRPEQSPNFNFQTYWKKIAH